MAKETASSWLVVEELYAQDDPRFVEELRCIHDADRLAVFAGKWYSECILNSSDPDSSLTAHRRQFARKALFSYLDLPLNAYRHEPLVKRLFKFAEKAGDDEAMAHFLVLFDRSLRRVRRHRRRYVHDSFGTREQAQARVHQLEDQGAENANMYEQGRNRFYVYALLPEEWTGLPRNTTMPTKETALGIKLGHFPRFRFEDMTESQRKKLEVYRLFSSHTRHYLRRRTWRYFRQLAKEHPERYVRAVVQALELYRDADAPDGLALLDNWGLIHILFHHCPALVAKANGWRVAQGHTLKELQPAPYFAEQWQSSPRVLLDLLGKAKARPVRQWTLKLLHREGATLLAQLPLREVLPLLAHEDAEIASWAAAAVKGRDDLKQVTPDQWRQLLEKAPPLAMDMLADLATTHLNPERLSLAEAASWAESRPLPLAKLGLHYLRGKTPTTVDECQQLLRLTDAEAEPIRPALMQWLRGVLSVSTYFRSEWVLELLDSRHDDVRREGWAWLQAEPRARDEISLWPKLLETPYDDLKFAFLGELEQRAQKLPGLLPANAVLDADLLRQLWASVLLNIHRGNRAKPAVLAQMLRRLEKHPSDADPLLPLVAVALRSLRGPEWRAGLAGVVQLVQKQPDMQERIRAAVPELEWE